MVTEVSAVARKRDTKRAQIIEAARVVLARDGLAACTARAVADASPLTKSAIHYYFTDIDEIVDRAVLAHLDAMLATLRGTAAAIPGPQDRLAAVVAAYLDTFADRPYAALLWYEYWISASRRGDLSTVDRMLARVEEFLTELTGPAGHGLLSWLLGTVVQQHVRPRPPDALRQEWEALVTTHGRRPA